MTPWLLDPIEWVGISAKLKLFEWLKMRKLSLDFALDRVKL